LNRFVIGIDMDKPNSRHEQLHDRSPELLRQNIALRRKLNIRIAWFVVVWLGTLAVASIVAYKAGETAAYKSQGMQARRDGLPMISWPYDDWNGPQFEWVVGWHIENWRMK